uniref:Golgin subfamily A conserved domain-containing protein n=1 Tax=Colobus angolensis palliatus TaxID=336983 RepID=A0A2K5IJ84_COLAP
IRGCGSRRHCCGSWRGCWSWGGKPSMSSGPSHTAASRSWWNNENKSALQLEQQVKELKMLGAPGSYQPAETAAKAQLSLMALPGEATGAHSEEEEEEAPQHMLSILQDLESQEAMVAFFNFAGARAQEEQRLCCQRLAQQVVSSQKPEAAAPAPGTGGESVCGETHRALQGAMEKRLYGRRRWT